MFNIIKMDSYRLLKSKSTYIILVIVAAMVCLTVYSFKILQDVDLGDYQVTEDTANIGITVGDDISTLESDSLSLPYLFTSMTSGRLLALFIGIFAAIFVNAEVSTGFSKNIAGQISNRGGLILSKVVAGCIYTFACYLVCFVTLILCSRVFLGYVEMGDFGAFMGVLAVTFVNHCAFFALITFITILFKSTALGLVFTCVFSMGVTDLFYVLLDWAVNRVFDISFSISNYTLTGNMTALTSGAEGEILTRAVLVSAVFLVATTLFGMTLFQKRDV